jgi:serine protease inhibitor
MSAKKIILIITAAAIIFAVLLCSGSCYGVIRYLFRKTPEGTKATSESDKIAENVDLNLVNINTDFALSIFAELSDRDNNSNVFISPPTPAGSVKLIL